MSTSQSTNPRQICESLLIEGKSYNIEHSILPSENAVADRLLARGIELAPAYEDLYNKLYQHPHALKAFLGLLLSVAAFWNPEKILQARGTRADLASVNKQIANKATELATLLEQRSELHNTSGFSSNAHYSVCRVIEAAAKDNHLFQWHVQERLSALSAQFDLKYWPSLSQFLGELASDAEAVSMEATDPLTAAATVAARSSLADFFKALFASIEENSVHNYGHIPVDFKPTDNALALLVNCVLDLAPDNLVGSEYVKRLRQRKRGGTKQIPERGQAERGPETSGSKA
ncbi:MAG: hypothetical protein ACREPQ_16760 [Rhodanobacter sp.]